VKVLFGNRTRDLSACGIVPRRMYNFRLQGSLNVSYFSTVALSLRDFRSNRTVDT
jgi:hypothetical protein